jgi:general secretion pathway protein G
MKTQIQTPVPSHSGRYQASTRVLDRPPVDPWGSACVYHVPGRHNVDYDLLSIGPDGKEGTADDIGNWQ